MLRYAIYTDKNNDEGLQLMAAFCELHDAQFAANLELEHSEYVQIVDLLSSKILDSRSSRDQDNK